jgi:hypothetical protein
MRATHQPIRERNATHPALRSAPGATFALQGRRAL